MFLKASANNRKETVLEYFIAAVSQYGLPSRIRVDHGGENNDLCEVMELLRGLNRGSALRGRSVHNQRIERAWVDLWNGVSNLFYDIFHFLEERGSLDIDNNVHVWALHYVFLPRLNYELQHFRAQWNNHGIRTAHHASPLQLFVGHALELSNARLTAIQDMFGNDDDDGQSASGAAEVVFEDASWETGEAVEVPDIPCPMSQEALLLLRQTIDPLAESAELGMDLYLRVLNFIARQPGRH